MPIADFDPTIVKPLIEAVSKAFKVQIGSEAKVVSLKPKQMVESQEVAIAAMMSLTSELINGTMALTFPKTTFLKVVNKLLGENDQEITQANGDAAAEILNIIYGTARPEINKAGHTFEPVIPSVVRGEKINISHPNAQIIGVMMCESELGPFRIEVSLKRVK